MRRLVLVLFMLLAAPAQAQDDPRYALANGCFTLQTGGAAVGKDGSGYAAGAGTPEAFTLKATDLGRYLLFGKDEDFMAGDGDAVSVATTPGGNADWLVRSADGGFTLALTDTGDERFLGVRDGRLALGEAATFAFVPADGCTPFPEVDLSIQGETYKGATSFGAVRGMLDAHMHMMAFEFLGGLAHCGKPWHPYGVTLALVDCPDHYPNGEAAVLESFLSQGSPLGSHDPVGWPTFRDWPNHKSLTHEQSYYRWLERAHQGGLRIFVNLFVENKVLCEIYPYKKNSCDEMDAVRLQAKRIYAMQDYIDAQAGGPGKGFFRIVKNPFEARRQINDGKLAVVLGIEVSEPFGCQIYNEEAKCTVEDIDREIDEVYDLGVRDMEIINKFDNALAGVAGDGGTLGVVINNGNKLETGRYWEMKQCTGAPEDHDNEQTAVLPHNDDDIIGAGLSTLVPLGQLPAYGPGPHCNARGLSDLGEHAIRKLMAKRMMVDPDHLSVAARSQAMALLEAERYPGVVSSHSWSTPDAYRRIAKLGGIIAPYAGSSKGFVKAWEETRKLRDPKRFFGLGWGADMNGFGAQGGPRTDAENPVQYPFKSFDGGVTFDRQKSGEREFDINADGVAHYGLYPDWVEDLRMQAGDAIVDDLSRGAEAYLQMWERTEGVRAKRCVAARRRFTRAGVAKVALGQTPEAVLRAAGQPSARRGRAFRFCVKGGGKVTAVFTKAGRTVLVASTARRHSARKLHRGSKLQAKKKLVVRGRWVYGVKGGKVRWVAVRDRTLKRGAVKRAVKAARLR